MARTNGALIYPMKRTWYLRFEYRLDAVEPDTDEVILACETVGHDQKKFMRYTAVPAADLLDVILFQEPSGRVLHEVISRGSRRMFFDFDLKSDLSEAEYYGPIGDLVYLIRCEISERYGIPIADIKIATGSSCRPGKLSFHLVTNCQATMEQNKELAAAIIEVLQGRAAIATPLEGLFEDWAGLSQGIDMAVYSARHNLRLVHCSKIGVAQSVKRLVDYGTPGATEQDLFVTALSSLDLKITAKTQRRSAISSAEINNAPAIISAMDEPELANHRYSHVNAPWIQFTRVTASYCEFCQRTHDGDNTLTVMRTGRGWSIGCIRGGSRPAVFLANTAAEITAVPVVTAPIPVEASPAKMKRWLANPARYFRNLSDSTAEIQDSKYIKLRQREPTIFMAAAKGAGKSQAVIEYIRRNKPKSVLMVTFRRSLAMELMKRCDVANLGFRLYSKITGDIDQRYPRVIVQIDSLWRVKWPECDLIVLDEIESLKAQIFSPLIRQISTVFARFERLIKIARTRIVMDADIKASTRSYINEVAGTTSQFIKNTNYGAAASMRYQYCLDEKSTKSALLKELKEGRKVVVPSGHGTKWNKALAKLIGKTVPGCKVAIYDSETMLAVTTQKEIEDLEREWLKYQVVIFSPTLQAGVSFNRAWFNCQYCFFTTAIGVNQQRQMMWRCRQFSENRMVIHIKKSSTCVGPIERGALLDMMAEMRSVDIPENIQREAGHNGWEFTQCRYFNLWVENTLTVNRDRNAFIFRFLREEYLSGARLIKAAELSAGLTIKKGLLSSLIVEVSNEEAAAIAAARDLTPPEALGLSRRCDCDLEETLQLKKYRIKTKFGFDPDEEKPASFFKQYGRRDVQSTFHNWRRLMHPTEGLENMPESLEQMRLVDKDRVSALRNADKDLKAEADTNARLYYRQHSAVYGYLSAMGIDNYLGGSVSLAELAKLDLTKEAAEITRLWPRKILDKDDVNAKLRFINGLTLGLYGFTLKKEKRKSVSVSIEHTFLGVLYSDCCSTDLPYVGVQEEPEEDDEDSPELEIEEVEI